MEGKIILERCPQNVKDIIVEKFNSLDNFYDYVLLLSHKQHVEKQCYSKEINNLKDELVRIGIDSMIADDLVDEIGTDYREIVATNYVKKLLGENWLEKLNQFEKIINGLQ